MIVQSVFLRPILRSVYGAVFFDLGILLRHCMKCIHPFSWRMYKWEHSAYINNENSKLAIDACDIIRIDNYSISLRKWSTSRKFDLISHRKRLLLTAMEYFTQRVIEILVPLHLIRINQLIAAAKWPLATHWRNDKDFHGTMFEVVDFYSTWNWICKCLMQTCLLRKPTSANSSEKWRPRTLRN